MYLSNGDCLHSPLNNNTSGSLEDNLHVTTRRTIIFNFNDVFR